MSEIRILNEHQKLIGTAKRGVRSLDSGTMTLYGVTASRALLGHGFGPDLMTVVTENEAVDVAIVRVVLDDPEVFPRFLSHLHLYKEVEGVDLEQANKELAEQREKILKDLAAARNRSEVLACIKAGK